MPLIHLDKTKRHMKQLLLKIIRYNLILIPFLSFTQTDSVNNLDTILIQKEIMMKLTGEKPINENIYITQRASPEERKLTADYLSNYLSKIGWKVENHHYKTTNGNLFLDLFLQPMNGVNVSAILPATTKSKEYILFGSHYDSERNCPGAIDNATGVTLSLTIAYKLMQLKTRNKNFIVVLFDQEEDGTVGSKAYAKMLKNSGKEIHSIHTIDMMGWDDDNNLGIEIELPSPILKNLYQRNAQKYNIPIQVTKIGSSDHQSFIDLGFNTLGITEEYAKRDTTPYIHTNMDTYDTVNFEYLASSTEFIFQIFKSLVQ